MEVRCIKGVDAKTWMEFKSLAVKNNLKMSLLLKVMLNEFEKRSEDFWNDILNGEKNLSNNEAKGMVEVINESRKERGFRE